MPIAKDLTINFTEFEPNSLVFTKLEENDRSKGQKIAYVRYQNPKTGVEVLPFIQTNWIKLNAYGIPRIDEYHIDDSKRTYIKIPVDLSIEESKKFSDVISKIDKYLDSTEMRKQLFGDNYSKYKYISLLRIPDEEEKPNKNKKQYFKPPYMKLKLDTTYPDYYVKTQVYKSVLNEGKRERTQITDIKTIDDLTRYISYLSYVRFIIRPVKLWSATKPDKTYGLTFKVIKIEYEPSNKTPSYTKQYLEADMFVDDNETSNNQSDNENSVSKPDISNDNKEKQPVKTQVVVNSDDSSDDDLTQVKQQPVKKPVVVNSDDSSDDDLTQVKQQPVKKPVVVNSDDSSDDEPIPVKQQPVKKPVVVNSDDSSDDDLTQAKQQPVKKPVVAKNKVVEVESDDETPKPVSKSTKPKTKK